MSTPMTINKSAMTMDPAELEQMAQHASAAAEFLKSMANPARLLVMCQLVKGEASVSELQTKAGLSMSALSQHLAVLREANLVRTRRQSQTIFYSLVEGPAFGVMQVLYATYCDKEEL
jgi:ArsR family transcriptional regulator, virulence genes transcriptional regulator